jgi:flavin reductase (DIM6/NTAB) family NADH-FMN oxidoreductase RutF
MNVNAVNFEQMAGHTLERLQNGGALLTVRSNGAVNTMTIGWGSLSVYWGRPVFIVPVRLSRHTHFLLEQAEEFTVTVPRGDELRRALGYCGSHSGRNVDKFAACGLTARPGRAVACPVVAEGWLHYECRIRGKVTLSAQALDPVIDRSVYEDGDYHTLYFGEIVECYTCE